MKKLIECVPNISEGRHSKIIHKIADTISEVKGITLLNVDIGYAVNRTVYTFIGSPQAVTEAIVKMYIAVSKLIDMTTHQGGHPRIGAVDVCPLIPFKNITITECNQIVNNIASIISQKIKISIFLYEKSQAKKHRKGLEQIRKGEYEKIFEKIKHPDWHPDFGKQFINKKFGVSVLGTRSFLLAYNINLDTKDIKTAKDIAVKLRYSGGVLSNHQKIKQGKLKYCKAIAWFIKEYNLIQISTNITNLDKVSLYDVYKNTKQLAQQHKIKIQGSELVGMIPKKYILKTAKQIAIEKKITFKNTQEKITFTIQYLGLNTVTEFIENKKIIN